MSSTAAVVPNVTYHLPKRVDTGFAAKKSLNGSALCSEITPTSKGNASTCVSSPSNGSDFVDGIGAACRKMSACLDSALRNSLNPLSVTNMNYLKSTEHADFSERSLSFHESSAPPLDAIIRQRISTFPGSLILTECDTPKSTTARLDRVLCNHNELDSLCRTGSQYVPRQPLGLGNAGNTCYLNSVLQCLLATGPLLAFISTKHQDPASCKTTTGQSASTLTGLSKSRFCGLCGIFRLIKEHTSHVSAGANFGYSASRHVVPSYFVGNVRAICPNLRPYQQEDAHEFLLGLLSRMEDNTMAGMGKLSRTVTETNVIRRIFGGVVRSEVTCHTCRKVSARDEQCFNLSVDITNGRSLQQCLFNYIRHEELCGQNAYKCENCRQLRAAVRRCTIFQGAPILIIQFNRFSRSHKLDHRVEFPSSLNLRPFMTDNKGPPVLYRLYATVNHEGYSCRSGHYVAFTRRNGTWYSHNDSFVNSTTPDHVLRQAPYLLFYEAVNPVPQLSRQQTPDDLRSPLKSSADANASFKSGTPHLPIPVDQIPLPPTSSSEATSSPPAQRPLPTAGTTSKNHSQSQPAAPRIIFNQNVARTPNPVNYTSFNGSSNVEPRILVSPVKVTPHSTSSSPNKPTVRQLLYGPNESPGLWKERETPTSRSDSMGHNSSSKSSAAQFKFSSGKRKRSSDSSSEHDSSFTQRHSSLSTDVNHPSKNTTVVHTSPSTSSPSSAGKVARTSGDSDSSIEWVPVTHKDLSYTDKRSVNSPHDQNKYKAYKPSKDCRDKDSHHHHRSQRHRHRRRKHRDIQDGLSNNRHSNNRDHPQKWRHHGHHYFHRK